MKKRAALKRMDTRLAASGEAEFNRDEHGLQNSFPEPAALLSSLDTLPFAADFRLVVLHNVDKAPKPLTGQIVSYLEAPNPTTVLVMTAVKLASNTRLYKAVAQLGSQAVIDCKPKRAYELPALVQRMAAARQLQLDMAAAQELVLRLGESRVLIDKELERLSLTFKGKDYIGAEDIRAQVRQTAAPSIWQLIDVVSDRQPAAAMKMLQLMDKESEMGIFINLVNRLRQLLVCKSLQQRGSVEMLASELGTEQWKVKNHPRYASRYSMHELVKALKSACTCEEALKSQPNKKLALQRWILGFCNTGR